VVRYSWRTQLKAAATPEAVLDLISRFLDEWKREEVASLPGDAWPRAIASKKQVLDFTLRLGQIHAAFRGDSATLARVQELLLFFTHASVRITQLDSMRADLQPSGAEARPMAKRPVADEEG
jgi:hypothetical protein